MLKNGVKILKNIPLLIIGLGLVSSFGLASSVSALATNPAGSGVKTATKASTLSTTDQTKISSIITKGDAEITRRLATLNKLDGNISSTTKLTTADQATLTSEVNGEITGLNSLKTTLDGSTTVATAQSAAQSIFSEYRVYALVVPQIYLIKAADDQQAVEVQLTSLSAKLTTRLAALPTNSALQTDLTTMNSDITSAQTISSPIETSVLALTPSDYDTNHSLLVGYYGQLKTAQGDNQGAYASAKAIVSSLAGTKG